MQEIHPLQLITDCEGPLTLNDHVFELCRDLIQPDGVRFCQQVRHYVKYLAEMAKKPEYRPGDTARLILPFLKAHGLTDAQLNDYFRKNLMLMPGVEGA